jgi:hypothetical protein
LIIVAFHAGEVILYSGREIASSAMENHIPLCAAKNFFFATLVSIFASHCGRKRLDGPLFAISCGAGNPWVPYVVILIDMIAGSQVKSRAHSEYLTS